MGENGSITNIKYFFALLIYTASCSIMLIGETIFESLCQKCYPKKWNMLQKLMKSFYHYWYCHLKLIGETIFSILQKLENPHWIHNTHLWKINNISKIKGNSRLLIYATYCSFHVDWRNHFWGKVQKYRWQTRVNQHALKTFSCVGHEKYQTTNLTYYHQIHVFVDGETAVLCGTV